MAGSFRRHANDELSGVGATETQLREATQRVARLAVKLRTSTEVRPSNRIATHSRGPSVQRQDGRDFSGGAP